MQRVNIIGAGLAGLSAAVTLAEKGCACNLISLQASERAQSVLAEGGINACLDTMGEEDTTLLHYGDTMRGGCDLADPEAVERLTEDAPDIVRWLAHLGVPFHMRDGRILQRNFGGQKKKRTAYAKSSTGKVLVSALIDEVRKYEAGGLVARYPHHAFVSLLTKTQNAASAEHGSGVDGLTDDNACKGVRVFDCYLHRQMEFYGPVILASGGMNGMFPGMTTGTVANSGDVTAAVFAQGVVLSNLEMLQYHPTTIGIAGKRLLVTEAARGEGGRLCVKRGGAWWYFMEERYPELKNLMPRDVVAREMFQVVRSDDCGDQVYLDATGLSDEIWKTKLPDMRGQLLDYLSLDPAHERIPVEPGIHYFMGGIDVDVCHRTSMKDLYAAGECCSQYHGANRLGGNSLLGAVYGGKTAARSILAGLDGVRAFTSHDSDMPGSDLPKGKQELTQADPQFIKRESEILLSGLGIVRSEKQLLQALSGLEGLSGEMHNACERNRLLLGRAMLLSALLRKESRGAHYREDYPMRDAGYQCMIKASVVKGEVVLDRKGF